MYITSAVLGILQSLKADGMVAEVAYNSPTKVNVDMDTMQHPAAVMYLFRDGAIDLASGLYREEAEVNVMFVTHQSELAFDGVANEQLLDDMAAAATEFVARLVADGRTEIVGDNVALRGIYDFNDKNTTGVSLQLRLREVAGHCLTPTTTN